MLIEVKKSHKNNSPKIITICNYGYFLENKKWEAIVINIKLLKKTIWIFRKKEYKYSWPVMCG